jgi:hypothetical protein
MPFNLERSTVNVKEFISKVIYDKTKPILFIINKKKYQYEDLLHNVLINTIKIESIKLEAVLSELTGNDVIKIINNSELELRDTDVDVIMPVNSFHYYMVVTIN